MPQYRKLHTKTLDSLDVDRMTDDFVRLTWVLLPLVVCKEGRGMMHPAWLRSNLYPLREDVTKDMITGAMAEFAAMNMITIYSVDGRDYFQIVNWHEYQSTAREAESPYPAPAQELVMSSSRAGNGNHARTSSISISTSMSEGGSGGKQELVTAVCQIARGAGVTGRATLELADWLEERGATPERVEQFGQWWSSYESGKPWLKNIANFWDDFEAGREPFFAKKDAAAGAKPDIAVLFSALQKPYQEARAELEAAGAWPYVERMGRWEDLKRKPQRDLEFAWRSA